MAGAEGSKALVQDLINLWKIKRGGSPALILKKLTDIYNVLEDVYSVEGGDELQDAIDIIGTGSGSIFIEDGTHIIDTTIDLDGCGSIVIYGHGDNTILQAVDGVPIFNITCAESVLIQLIKLDLTAYTFLNPNTQGIIINEVSDNVCFVENITIEGDGTNGYGIEVLSDNCVINHCRITDMKYGVNIDGDSNNITNNTFTTNTIGIRLTVNSETNYVYENILTSNTVQWSDNGTNNEIEYICYSATDIQQAIDSIGAKSGTIQIVTGNISVSTTIDVDGGGDYIIKGGGDASLFVPNAAGISVFKVTNARSCIISDLKIDCTAYTNTFINDEFAIWVNETGVGNSQCIIERVGFTGDGANGCGILLQSNNNIARNCEATLIEFGIIVSGSYNSCQSNLAYVCGDDGLNVTGNYNTFNNNISYNNAGHGLYIFSQGNTIVGNVAYGNIQANKAGIAFDTSSDYNVCTGNNCYGNQYGIKITTSDYLTITGNSLTANLAAAMYIAGSNYSTISSNNCSETTSGYGIYVIQQMNYCILSANNCSDIDYSSAGNGAGIYLTGTSNSNSINGNTILNGNNSGVGNHYGIWIGAGCDNNIISGNVISGNNIQWLDSGTNNQIEYRCYSNIDIQQAIDSIAAKSGTISIVSGDITISTTIDVDGGGDYIIEGQGNGTVLKPSTDNTILFNLTSASSTVFRRFKIDGSDLLYNEDAIYINEGSDNPVLVDNITITGDSRNRGAGIKGYSDNITVQNCNVNDIAEGIVLEDVSNCIIANNRIESCTDGIAIYNVSDNCIISNNNVNDTDLGITIDDLSNSTVTGNTANNGIYYGLAVGNIINVVITGNSCNNNLSAGFYCYGTCSNNTITGNIFTNSRYGIYMGIFSASNVIVGNIITDCDWYGLYMSSATDTNVTGNYISSNNRFGIYLGNLSYSNSISSNTCINNNANNADNGGGIFVDGDNISIIGNTCNDNTNAGAGTAIGIEIGSSAENCRVHNNIVRDNDVNYTDNGTNTDTAYICYDTDDIQNAIDSIGSKSGTIQIVSDITISTTIEVDGGGDYIIEGKGAGTVLTVGGNRNCFWVTSARSCIIKNLKIDLTALTGHLNGVYINEASDNRVIVDNIHITGDGTNGYGVQIASNNCIVQNCYFTAIGYGILVGGINNVAKDNTVDGVYSTGIWLNNTNNIVQGNTVVNVTFTGIASGAESIISGNMIKNCGWGIYTVLDNNSVVNNIVLNNAVFGIYVFAANNCTITGNTCNDNNLNDADDGGGIVIMSSDGNTISGNVCHGNKNIGAGLGYGIRVRAVDCNDNVIAGNSLIGNSVDYHDAGTDTILLGDNLAYSASWSGDLGTATRGALYDKIQLVVGTFGSYLPLAGGSLTGDLYIANDKHIYFGAGTDGDSQSCAIYTDLNNDRLWVRAEETDGVASFTNYGMVLPKTGSCLYCYGTIYVGYGAESILNLYNKSAIRFYDAAEVDYGMIYHDDSNLNYKLPTGVGSHIFYDGGTMSLLIYSSGVRAYQDIQVYNAKSLYLYDSTEANSLRMYQTTNAYFVTTLGYFDFKPASDTGVVIRDANSSDYIGIRHDGSNARLYVNAGDLILETVGGDVICYERFKVYNGQGCYAYSSDESKYIYMYHDNTHAYITSSSGDLILDSLTTEVVLGCNLDLRSNSIQNCAYIDVQAEIRHDGDTDTSIAFGTNTITIETGGIPRITIGTGITMGGAINMGVNEINNCPRYEVDAGDGNGVRFWDGSTAYSIYMSQEIDASYGGRVDNTSDYNMYFIMSGGTNRGFQFCSSLLNPYFSINPNNVWSNVNILARGGAQVKAYDAGNTDIIRMYHDGANGWIDVNSGTLTLISTTETQIASGSVYYRFKTDKIAVQSNKVLDIGSLTYAFDDVYADNFVNRGIVYVEKVGLFDKFKNMKLEPHPTVKNSVGIAEIDNSLLLPELIGKERYVLQFKRKFVDKVANIRSLSNIDAEALCKTYTKEEDVPEDIRPYYYKNPDTTDIQDFGNSLGQWSMVNAIVLQELIAKNEALEARIEKLENL